VGHSDKGIWNKMKYYAGIGSRKTPIEVLQIMTKIAEILEKELGFILRSGGADGADSAFEMGAEKKEVYLPWKGFNSNDSNLYDCYSDFHKDIAKQFHPRWESLSQGAKKLMIRNSAQIYGLNKDNVNNWSKFIICWTADGKASGGTGQAIRIAEYEGIPVLNLKNCPHLLEPDTDGLINFVTTFCGKNYNL
jgi:hypothetical protein